MINAKGKIKVADHWADDEPTGTHLTRQSQPGLLLIKHRQHICVSFVQAG